MSTGAFNNNFDNLTQSGLLRVNSKDDKNVSFSIDVFNGGTRATVFTGSGGKPWSHPLPRKSIENILILLRKMKAECRPCREAIMLNVYDPDIKKMKNVGQIGIGIAENLQVTIDISHNDLNGRHIFPIKDDAKFDYSNTTLSERDRVEAMLNLLITVLDVQSPIAERLSSFKKPAGGFGGNKGSGSGYNNNNNQNRSYGNNNNSQQQSGTFGGSEDNDLHV